MPRPFILLLGTVTLCGPGAGCGTVGNMGGAEWFMMQSTRPPFPFGGAVNDMKMVSRGLIEFPPGEGGIKLALMAIVDLPFSIVGDIVTLPWTTYEFASEMRNPTDRYQGFKIRETETPFTPGSIPKLGRTEAPHSDRSP